MQWGAIMELKHVLVGAGKEGQQQLNQRLRAARSSSAEGAARAAAVWWATQKPLPEPAV
jgi:hypothetical protein